MKPIVKHIIGCLLTFFLVLGVLPAVASGTEFYQPVAADDIRAGEYKQHIDPVCVRINNEAGSHQSTVQTDVAAGITGTYVESFDEAVAFLREGLVSRQEAITISYCKTTDWDYTDLWHAAMEHTGKPAEGDYLSNQLQSWYYEYSVSYVDDVPYENITFHALFFTTATQEAEMDAAVDALLAELDLWNDTDYEKVCGIYDWICNNVTYDYEHYEQNKIEFTYPLCHSAYAALVNRTAVCQGYALLFYRLALELGVDNRYISGYSYTADSTEGHGWNIVKLDDLYYYVDATWDAGVSSYRYFLRGVFDFPNHYRDKKYNKMEFHAAYPMSRVNYGTVQDDTFSGICGDDLVWTLTADGVLTISGTGDMYSDVEQLFGWYEYTWQTKKLVVGEGVTSLADGAFAEWSLLAEITVAQTNENYCVIDGVLFTDDMTVLIRAANSICGNYTVPEGVTTIWESAFQSCTGLSAVSFPVSLTDLGDYAFKECLALKSITFTGNYPKIGSSTFQDVHAEVIYPDPTCDTTWPRFCSDYGGLLTWYWDLFTHDYVVVITAPTCTEKGYSTYTCSKCGSMHQADYVDATGHRLGAWYQSVAPTCTTYGERRSDCVNCDYYRTDVIAPGHSWDEGVVSVVPTEETEGTYLYTCVGCGAARTETIPILEHVHEYIPSVIDPTCTEYGYTAYICRCGDNYEENYVEATGHSFETVITLPTCTEWGFTTYTCHCGVSSKDDYIFPAGHSYAPVVTKPSCTEQGYTTQTCADCGDSFVDSYVDATGHSYTLNGNHTCDVCKYSKTPSQPAMEDKTYHCVTLVKTDGFEYSSDGITWQSSNVFTGLSPDTTYTFYQRVKASSTALVSGASVALTVRTDEEPVYTIVFKNWDGTVISTKTYHWGDAVDQPPAPTREEDSNYTYTFFCWDAEVVNCAGDAVYTAVFESRAKMVISTQPATQKVKSGAAVTYTVEATGTGLNYQWQSSADGETWKNCTSPSAVKSTFTFTGTTKHSSNYYRCIITDAYGNVVYTDTVRLYVLGVTTQPKTQKEKAGDTVKFIVKATGSNKRYQWQVSTDGKTWKDCTSTSAKKATFSFTGKTKHSGNYYRCRITDSGGNTVYTNTVRLYILGITEQPVSKTVNKGKTAKFTVEATGSGKTYQWQVSTDGGKTWKNCTSASAKKATFGFTTKTSHNGNYYRCQVSDNAGNRIYTNKVKLKVK